MLSLSGAKELASKLILPDSSTILDMSKSVKEMQCLCRTSIYSVLRRELQKTNAVGVRAYAVYNYYTQFDCIRIVYYAAFHSKYLLCQTRYGICVY